jgi:hypothetical protein
MLLLDPVALAGMPPEVPEVPFALDAVLAKLPDPELLPPNRLSTPFLLTSWRV